MNNDLHAAVQQIFDRHRRRLFACVDERVIAFHAFDHDGGVVMRCIDIFRCRHFGVVDKQPRRLGEQDVNRLPTTRRHQRQTENDIYVR